MELAEDIGKPPLKSLIFMLGRIRTKYLPIAILYLHKMSYQLYIPELKVVKSQNITEKQLSAMQRI